MGRVRKVKGTNRSLKKKLKDLQILYWIMKESSSVFYLKRVGKK